MPKNEEVLTQGIGVLYTGDGRKLAEITEVDIEAGITVDSEKTDIFIKPSILPQPIECTFSCHISPWDEILLITGKRPTNNWMKMHGGIMERKVQLRKARKRRRKI